MSLNTREIPVRGQSAALRLSSKGIAKYLTDHGTEGAPPLVSLMLATEDFTCRVDLLEQALTFPGNENSIRRGGDLLDALVDEGYSMDDVNALILDLLHDCGMVDGEGLTRLVTAARKNSGRIVKGLENLLAGNGMEADGPQTPQEAQDGPEPENPITIPGI